MQANHKNSYCWKNTGFALRHEGTQGPIGDDAPAKFYFTIACAGHF